MKPANRLFCIAALALLTTLTAFHRRTIRLDLIPTDEKLSPELVGGDGGFFTSNKIAVVNVSGLISTAKPGGLLSISSSGQNPVSDFRETLDAIAADPSVKAVVLRMNTPGGTVTASDMMYKDLLAFKASTHKPVVVEMLDVCASGGYYLSCAADYRMAYPTTITGSIGVIIETMNFTETLNKLGISARAIKSKENKDMASPFRPMTDNDRILLQALVNQFYAGFLDIVKTSPQHIKPEDWEMVTDGRVFTGKDAVRLGLIDANGTLDDAIAKAKSMAGISKAKLVMFTRHDSVKGSAYAHASDMPAQMNMINITMDGSAIVPTAHPSFLYLWTGE